jgi:acetyl esterase/lipase
MQLDFDRMAVIGFSAGSYMARLSIAHLLTSKQEPRIQLAAASLWFGMGGSAFLDTWITALPNADQNPVPSHLLPENVDCPTAQPAELADCPYTAELPGYKDCPTRAAWCKYWWDSGCVYDLHLRMPGFSETLRAVSSPSARARYVAQLGPQYRLLFPELLLDHIIEHKKDASFTANSGYVSSASIPAGPAWPETILVHGSKDPIVPFEESTHTKEQLDTLGIHAELVVVTNGDHDLVHFETKEQLPEREQAIARVVDFLLERLVSRDV